MAGGNREFLPNQVFLGLPWKNVRPKYERIITQLAKKYPLYFTIVGRDDGQDAKDLFEIIKQRIAASSYAVFDATGGNANVSLEYGYAEGIDVPRAIFLSDHKAVRTSGSPIISDLTGKRRVHYKNETTLSNELDKLCRDHDYTKRFEKALISAMKRRSKGDKKRGRALALKTIHALDGKQLMRRAELFQHLQALDYNDDEIETMLSKLHSSGVIRCSAGRFSDVYIV